MNIQEIRRKIELYTGELSKEFYLQGAGLKNTVDFDSVSDRYPDLFSQENLEIIKKSLSEACENEEKNRLSLLLESFYGEIISQKLKEDLNEFFVLESELRVESGNGSQVPYRSAIVYLLNEQDRKIRGRMQDAIELITERRLNPLLEKLYRNESHELSVLGFKSRSQFFHHFSGIDLFSLDKMMQDFVLYTNDLYEEYLYRYAKIKVNIPLSELKKHDLSFILRATEFDSFFPKEHMYGHISDFITRMGIDMSAGGRIIYDLENRENKTSRAFCTYTRIPEEVYLVFPPRGGEDDYYAFLHELGHALHFANTDRDLHMEFKWFGDSSVSEAYAVNFDHLTMDEHWMNYYLGVNKFNNEEYFKYKNFKELVSLRRLASKLHYEMKLSSSPDISESKRYYAKVNTEAMKVEYSSTNYLMDVDPNFYCARYILAWILQAGLQSRLRTSFGEMWFHSKQAGDFLEELWYHGQKYDAQELAKLIGMEHLSTEKILANLRKELSTKV
ncbi:MAG: hypothetical protein K8I03_15335 [Ignavibacteria bacterium]|nr:hypothetical protein [Ignavibacteria bacterium]